MYKRQVQNHGWSGPKEELNAPLLFNLRRDPYERAAEESGMYLKWMGQKMWAFGPAQAAIQQHLATFEEWPPVTPESPAEKTGGVGTKLNIINHPAHTVRDVYWNAS